MPIGINFLFSLFSSVLFFLINTHIFISVALQGFAFCCCMIYDPVFIIIGIQPLGRSGQRAEFSPATGMALVRCILGKFLGVACHCFPPFLDVPTFNHQVPPRPPRRERSQRRKWELWARMLSGNFA